jgi:glutamyl-tRNA reductase
VALLRELRGKLDLVRQRELTVALTRLPDLTPAERAVVERLAQSLMKQFLHRPAARLRAATGLRSDVIDDARYLFALDDARDSRLSARGSDERAA